MTPAPPYAFAAITTQGRKDMPRLMHYPTLYSDINHEIAGHQMRDVLSTMTDRTAAQAEVDAYRATVVGLRLTGTLDDQQAEDLMKLLRLVLTQTSFGPLADALEAATS